MPRNPTSFRARLWRYPAPGGWTFARIPERYAPPATHPWGRTPVHATVDGRDYRFVNTHLEIREPAPGNPLSRVFQAAQAMQLITTLALTNPSLLPVMIVGDINSSPEDEPALGGIIPPTG